MQNKPIISELGEAALLCEYSPGTLNLDRQQQIWMVAESLSGITGIQEVIPGMNNLAVIYDTFVLTPDTLSARIETLWTQNISNEKEGRLHEVPVIYGGEAGPDLIMLADQAGMSPIDFATLHSKGDYTVYALGSQPGFGYLGGLDPRLAAPRRETVHPRIEAGQVIIGGTQTAVQSCTTPSGWHMIGWTDTVFFDPDSESPALLSPGDRVIFKLLEVLT